MQINDVKYKSYIKEICNIFSPLNWLLMIFCLNSQGSKYKRPCNVIIKMALPTIVLGCLNLLTLYYKFMYMNMNLRMSVRYTDAVQMIYDIIQYTFDLIFVYKYGAEMYLEYLKQYACIDGLLATNYSGIKQRLKNIMAFLISMWMFSSLTDYIIWSNGFGFIPATIYSLAYIYILIKILTNLDMTVNVIHVEYRLLALGDIIQDCCGTIESSPGIIEDVISKKEWFYNVKIRRAVNPKSRPVNVNPRIKRQEVKWLCRCYLLLIEQIKFINKMFGIRILLNSLSLLIDIVRFTNLIVLVVGGYQVVSVWKEQKSKSVLIDGDQKAIDNTGYKHGYYAAIATLWRTLTCAAVVVSLVEHCERVYRQRERIICLLDHLIINKTLDDNLLSAFSEFRSLVQSRTINFHMAHFIRLEYPLLVSISSVVVTYTIILLQS